MTVAGPQTNTTFSAYTSQLHRVLHRPYLEPITNRMAGIAYGMLLSWFVHYCVWEVIEVTSTRCLPLSLSLLSLYFSAQDHLTLSFTTSSWKDG